MAHPEDDRVPEPSKLTQSKKLWAEQGRFLTGRTARADIERLPPGQHLVRDWPVLDLGKQPEIDLLTWRLTIDGAIAHPESFDWPAFQSLPQTHRTSDIHCVTSWSRLDNHWTGVSTHDLLARVAPQSSARFVLLRSFDGYTTNLRLEDFSAPEVILAHSWEGAPLTRAHGGPVRLVVPHLYFWKSAKWIKRITFLTRDTPGFWEQNGYHNDGDPWREQRYAED
jgi:DMSO/TMAO reductase YedYZ molybdopterin-dependent catalytic subunit